MPQDYTALIAKWATLTPGTTAQKLAQINAITVPTGIPVPALLRPSQVLNACIPADIASLPAASVTLLALLLSGATVDASQGTTIRAAVQAIFAGKTTTLANLGALVAPFDSPVVPWSVANNYGGQITFNDLVAAGGLT